MSGLMGTGVRAEKKSVYFSQTLRCYTWAYLPHYPEASPEDSTVTFDHINNTWSFSGPHAAAWGA